MKKVTCSIKKKKFKSGHLQLKVVYVTTFKESEKI